MVELRINWPGIRVMNRTRRGGRLLATSLVALLALPGVLGAAGQRGAPVRGHLIDSVTGKPVPGALVFVEELQRETRSAPDGSFAFADVPPGTYHLLIAVEGYATRHVEVTVAADPVTSDITLVPELHFTEVVSVSPEPRSQFESYEPTSVLQGRELLRDMRGTLGAALDGQPGVAQREFGQGPSRPVVRGFDGDRVLILENGSRMGDLSSQSGDHGVVVNPATASRVEIVRGPATLLYGTGVLGGLVNVISESIPTARSQKPSGSFTFDAGSGNAEAALSGNVMFGAGPLVLRAGASGRTAGDVKTPQGPVENSQARGGFADAAVSWVGDTGYVGVSYGYDGTRYGIPYVEGGSIEVTPRRQSLDVRAEGQSWDGPITSARASAAIRRYQHDEIDAGAIATSFTNDTNEFDVHAHHRALGRLRGTFGGWGFTRAFAVEGAEVLSPPVDQQGFAAFFYEEAAWPRIHLQFGGRYDYTAYQAGNGLPDRTFNEFSGSIGVLVHLSPSTTVAVSLARVTRAPALEELYFEGPHPGNFAYEIGNASLPPETSSGIDVSLRWQLTRSSGEVSYFRNAISNYILRDFAGVFEDELPVINYVSSKGLMQGFEAHADVQLTRSLTGEITADYVYGQVVNLDAPMPRIPPFRVRGGVHYQRDALQIGGTVVVAAGQNRVFPPELPTSGYGLLNLFAAYSFPRGRTVNTITATLNNATNELYRNHLSFIKQLAPETGRNVRVAYSVGF